MSKDSLKKDSKIVDNKVQQKRDSQIPENQQVVEVQKNQIVEDQDHEENKIKPLEQKDIVVPEKSSNDIVQEQSPPKVQENDGKQLIQQNDNPITAQGEEHKKLNSAEHLEQEQIPETKHQQITLQTPKQLLINQLKEQMIKLEVLFINFLSYQSVTQNIQAKLQQEKTNRSGLQEQLDSKTKELLHYQDLEKQAIKTALDVEFQKILSNGLKKQESTQTAIQKEHVKDETVQKVIDGLDVELQGFRKEEQKINSKLDLAERENENLNIHLRKLQNESYGLENISVIREKTIIELNADIEEMKSAIQKMKDVRGTLNKVIKDSHPRQQDQNYRQQDQNSRQYIKTNDRIQEKQQSQDRSFDYDPYRASSPVPVLSVSIVNDDDGFWFKHQNSQTKSPLKLPKLNQNQY